MDRAAEVEYARRMVRQNNDLYQRIHSKDPSVREGLECRVDGDNVLVKDKDGNTIAEYDAERLLQPPDRTPKLAFGPGMPMTKGGWVELWVRTKLLEEAEKEEQSGS